MPRLPTCTVQGRRGDFCDATEAPDMPFPICSRHALQLYMRMRETVSKAQRDGVTGQLLAWQSLSESVQKRALADAKHAERDHWVYYIELGEHIKIGTTTNLATRVNSYPPAAKLLAYEPGDGALERQRHLQFRHLLDARREWFRRGVDLMDFIAQLDRSNRAA